MHQLNKELAVDLIEPFQSTKTPTQERLCISWFLVNWTLIVWIITKRDSFTPELLKEYQYSTYRGNVPCGWRQISVEEKGLFSVEKFLMARELMYWQVYLHKTGLAAEFSWPNLMRYVREKLKEETSDFPSFAFFYDMNKSMFTIQQYWIYFHNWTIPIFCLP